MFASCALCQIYVFRPGMAVLSSLLPYCLVGRYLLYFTFCPGIAPRQFSVDELCMASCVK
jgi:hypothetical protein